MESVSDQDDLTLSAKVRCSDASSLWLVGRLSLLGPSRPMSVSEVGRVEPFLDLASCSSYRSRSPMYSTAYNSTAIQSFLLSPSLSTTSTTTVATAGGTAAMSFGSLHEVHNEVARNSLRQLQRRLSRRESLPQHERHDLGEINLRDGQKWEPGRNKRGLKLDLRPDSQAIHLDPDPGRAHNGATDTSVNGDPDSPSRMQLFAVCPGLLFDTRPMSSCSHVRSAHEPGSPMANVSSYLRISLDSSEPSMMTARDIATLSPTNQQKSFAPFGLSQRGKLPQEVNLASTSESEVEKPVRLEASLRPHGHRRPLRKKDPPPKVTGNNLRTQTSINSEERRFYASLPDKVKRLHLTDQEKLAAQQRPQHIFAGTPDPNERNRLSLSAFNSRAAECGHEDMESCPTESSAVRAHDQTDPALGLSSPTESLSESLRWLEEEDDLDLRLFLDDYHINLRHEVPSANKHRHYPSFRRHLSISKLPFARASTNSSRPGTKDTVTAPRSAALSGSSLLGEDGHTRRRSRTLSLLSPIKPPLQYDSANFDVATSAAHYSDPEARKRLRAYLASPQKFDEMIEFGFRPEDGTGHSERQLPLIAPVQPGFDFSDTLGTFLDDENSTHSGNVSLADTDSPKTPDASDAAPSAQPLRPGPTQTNATTAADAGLAREAAREMTMRMTLTRPDLRANETDNYWWKVGANSRVHIREGSLSPLPDARQGGTSKEFIERRFAAIDFEHAASHDPGVVRRIWNRVRRG